MCTRPLASYLSILHVFLLLLVTHWDVPAVLAAGGKWELLLPSIGISSMHMQLLQNDKVIMFDRTDFGKSNISLPDGQCRTDPNFGPSGDCSAHSVEYDIATNSIRSLMVLTNVWCSSGAVMEDGTLVQTGGTAEGERAIRIFNPCSDNACDWQETPDGLLRSRWYSTNHLLPDGRQIILGGRGQFNFEFHPKVPSADQVYGLRFLEETNDPNIENNLYPFVFLNQDGNLFIFANNRAILFNYITRVIVKTYPEIPGGDPRSYPSTGSAVLLPLKMQGATQILAAEVLVCGGAPKGSYVNALNNNFVGALDTCARININDRDPKWILEKMPLARVMGDMVLLPDGNVLLINGGSAGAAGWELGRDPVLTPCMYRPDNLIGSRFEVQNPTNIPRMYHSTASLLRDGRVIVGGSNPHNLYSFTGVLFPTELSLEAFSPPYLEPESARLRPEIVSPASGTNIGYGRNVQLRFSVSGSVNANSVKVTMLAPPFNTHSFSMGQRLLVLRTGNLRRALLSNAYIITVTIPQSTNLAPSGYYLMFVVNQGIPSEGIWVKLQ
ncbi:hypothetical protein LIER_39235 [Lithospermum erythrorhizon]|uniref:Aldehyde oxidase GLOX n=1 Tax=Lithospermum erythrorhizon TaxID=34254 RepID=A0AAV3QE35_LITER